MSSSVLPNFDWKFSDVTTSVVRTTLSAASHPYRLVENSRLVCFKVTTSEDVDDRASINVKGLSPSQLKIFLAKILVLGWLYIDTEPEDVSPFIFSRLTAYVRYYEAILEELRCGNLEIFDHWWRAESTYKYFQHSSGRVERENGPLEESDVLLANDIEWGLEEVFQAENLALVTQDQLQEAAPYVGDWIKEEVERVLGTDVDKIDELISKYDSEADEDEDSGAESAESAAAEAAESAAAEDSDLAAAEPDVDSVAAAEEDMDFSMAVDTDLVFSAEADPDADAEAAVAEAEAEKDADASTAVAAMVVEDDAEEPDVGTVADNTSRGRYHLRKGKKRAIAVPKPKGSKKVAEKDEVEADTSSGGEAWKPVEKGKFRIIKPSDKETTDANPKRSKKGGIKKGKTKAQFDPVEQIPGILDPERYYIELDEDMNDSTFKEKNPKIEIEQTTPPPPQEEAKEVKPFSVVRKPSPPAKNIRHVDFRQVVKHKKNMRDLDLIKRPTIYSKSTPSISSDSDDQTYAMYKLINRRKKVYLPDSIPNQYVEYPLNPFMNNLVQKMGGNYVESLPKGASLRVVRYSARNPREDWEYIQLPPSEDESEVDQVENLLSECTPPPVDDDMGGYESSITSHSLGQILVENTPSIEPQMWEADTGIEMAGEAGAGAGAGVMTTEDDEPLAAETAAEAADTVAEVAAEAAEAAAEAAEEEETRKKPLQRTRGRPAGVKNKPKKNATLGERPRRLGTKRARSDSAASPTPDTFDIDTPIIVRVRSPVKVDPPPPVKRARKTKTVVAKDNTMVQGDQHMAIGSRERGRHILQNFGADLQSFYDHLNNQSVGQANDEHYEKWLSRVKDALETTDINKSAFLTNNVPNVLKVSQKIKSRNADDSLLKKFLDVIRIFQGNRA